MTVIRYIKRRVENGIARFIAIAARLVYRTWTLPLWIKALLLMLVVSVVSGKLSTTDWFNLDTGTLVGVLTLQTGFGVYLVSVTRRDHADRLVPVVREILDAVVDKEEELREVIESTSYVTLHMPQRLGIYALSADILMCPCLMFQSRYVTVWVITMTFVCMIWLLIAILLLRVELYAKWLSDQVQSLRKFLEKHGQEVIVLLVGMWILVGVANWTKKHGGAVVNTPNVETATHEKQTS